MFDAYLNIFCNIESVSLAQDAAGEKIETWGTLTSNIPCRLEASTGRLMNLPKNIYEKASHILFMRKPTSPSTILTRDHRISISTVKYNILGVQEIQDEDSVHHLEIILERIL